MLDNNYSERERLVIDLYKNQNKSIREIAKMAKMSFRDIGYILKNVGLSHGITNTEDTIITNLLIINNSHNLIGSITRKRTCRGGCQVRSI
jgi:hypothetical protein